MRKVEHICLRHGGLGVKLGFTLLCAAVGIGFVAQWYSKSYSESSHSLEEQKLFKLPKQSSLGQVDSPQDKSSETQSSEIDWKNWRILTEPVELSSADLQNRCVTLVDQLVSEFPESVEANSNSARVYFFIREPEKAERYWHNCLRIGPIKSDYYAGLGMILEESGRPLEVISLLELAHKEGFRTEETTAILVKALDASGQIDLAASEIEKNIEAYSKSQVLWRLRGQVLGQLNRHEEAEVAFRKSLEFGGNSQRILPALVLCLARQNKQQEASELRKRFASDFASSSRGDDRWENHQEFYDANIRQLAVEVQQTCARVYAQNKRTFDYHRALQGCIELDPTDTKALNALADLALNLQRVDEATKIYQRLIAVAPKDLNGYMKLSSLAMRIGDKTLAEQTLLRASDLPDGHVALHSLAQMYLLDGRQAEALSFAERVVNQDASLESYLLHYFVSSSMGRLDLARQSMEKCQRLAPNDPRVQSMRLPSN